MSRIHEEVHGYNVMNVSDMPYRLDMTGHGGMAVEHQVLTHNPHIGQLYEDGYSKFEGLWFHPTKLPTLNSWDGVHPLEQARDSIYQIPIRYFWLKIMSCEEN